MQLALPNTQNFPAVFSERPRDDLLALHIVIELTEPKFEPTFRNVREFAPEVSMPKASIYEQSDPVSWKHEVWSAKNASVTTPARNAMMAK